jgi:hypothetical protein
VIALLLAGVLLAPATDPGPITVSPENIAIADLRPGTTGAVDVAVTNTSGGVATITVTGHLTSDHPLSPDDTLNIALAACSQPWAGVPKEPTAIATPPVCSSGEVPPSSGGLPALPLEAGQTVHLLISAGLGPNAGNGAQGQTWDASLDVHAVTAAPAVAVSLPFTGAEIAPYAVWGVASVVAGGGLLRVVRGRRRKVRSA